MTENKEKPIKRRNKKRKKKIKKTRNENKAKKIVFMNINTKRRGKSQTKFSHGLI